MPRCARPRVPHWHIPPPWPQPAPRTVRLDILPSAPRVCSSANAELGRASPSGVRRKLRMPQSFLTVHSTPAPSIFTASARPDTPRSATVTLLTEDTRASDVLAATVLVPA